MYHWNVRALASELKEGKLSEREKFSYYFATIVLVEVAMVVLMLPFGEFTLYNYLPAAVEFCLMLGGTYFLFRTYGDGPHFIERVVCVSWPVTVQFLFALTLVHIPLALAVTDEALYMAIELVANTALLVWYFRQVARWLVFVRGAAT